MAHLLDNKWNHGKVRFDFSKIAPALLARDGIVPLQVVLDASIGSELALLLIDHTPFVHKLAKAKPFHLRLKSGVVNTDHGPILFHLFYVPDPTDPAAPPLAMFDVHANPFDSGHMAMWRDLSRQTHWHVFLVGPGNVQVDFYEFANTFALGETLDMVECGVQWQEA